MTDRSARSRLEGPSSPGAGRQPGRRRGSRRAAEQASQLCPYLRPGNGAGDAVPGDRCRAEERPIHVSDAYQAAVCRTAHYRSCPRFVDDSGAVGPSLSGTAEQGRRRLLRTGIPSIVPDENWPPPPGRATPSPDTPVANPDAAARTAAGPARIGKARHRVSLAELIVLALSVSIVFAFLFVGYAVMYRLQLRGGIEIAAARGGMPASAAQPAHQLVPTFTPTSPAPAVAPTPVPGAAATSPALATAVPEPTAPVPTPIVRPPAISPPTRLVIPKIDVDISVIPVGVRIATIAGRERVVWSDVANAGAFHEASAYPGNQGNTVINGHRDILGSVFRHLDRLGAGDQIIVYVGDVPYPYFVTETLVVPDTFASDAQRAENAKLIGDFPEERLTLVTCTPVGLATHRLVVIARPLSRGAPRLLDAGLSAQP